MTGPFVVFWVGLKGVVRDGSFRGVLGLFKGRSSLPPHSSGCCLSLVTDFPPGGGGGGVF